MVNDDIKESGKIDDTFLENSMDLNTKFSKLTIKKTLKKKVKHIHIPSYIDQKTKEHEEMYTLNETMTYVRTKHNKKVNNELPYLVARYENKWFKIHYK
jgi:cytolysin (calcineurin-like family phosphatase)